MGKPGAKAKPSATQAVVKAAAKKVAKGSCCCDSWTTVSPEVFKPWGDGSCVPSSFCWQEGHQQLPGPNEKGNFRQLLLWMLWLDVLPCSTMFHNKKMDDIQSTSPTKVVRQHVHSLYLIEQLSGQATGKLQAEIAECKVPGFKIRKKLCEKPTSCPTSLQEYFEEKLEAQPVATSLCPWNQGFWSQESSRMFGQSGFHASTWNSFRFRSIQHCWDSYSSIFCHWIC